MSEDQLSRVKAMAEEKRGDDMSAYLWAVQIGMPEGMTPSDQQMWLHKWRLEQQAEIERLTLELEAEKASASHWARLLGDALANTPPSYYEPIIARLKTNIAEAKQKEGLE